MPLLYDVLPQHIAAFKVVRCDVIHRMGIQGIRAVIQKHHRNMRFLQNRVSGIGSVKGKEDYSVRFLGNDIPKHFFCVCKS